MKWGPLDFIPIWKLFLATVAVILLSVEGGFRLGRHRRRNSDHEEESSVGSMAGAALGLLAFLLAFTFGMAASQYENRKRLVLEEANAIGTTYLRSEMLPEPYRTEIQKLLREYVDVRTKVRELPGEKEELKKALQQMLDRSEQLQTRIWSQAVALGKMNPDSIVIGLFLQSMNEVIDLHMKRVTAGLRNRIAQSIWIALYFVAILSMIATGYRTGLTGRRSTISILLLALTFSAVLMLIKDLDRPRQQLFTVSQQSMLDLQRQIGIKGTR
jgi:hypothetical protein